MQDAGKAADESMGLLSSRGRLLLEPSIGSSIELYDDKMAPILNWIITFFAKFYDMGAEWILMLRRCAKLHVFLDIHIPGASEKHSVLLKVFPARFIFCVVWNIIISDRWGDKRLCILQVATSGSTLTLSLSLDLHIFMIYNYIYIR